jgi:hypothetical protein
VPAEASRCEFADRDMALGRIVTEGNSTERDER